MNEAEQAHEKAMRLAQEAFVARQDGDERNALAGCRKALENERRAAETHIAEDNSEPTRSILLRSAASLAIECSEPRQAERLVAQALAHDPPAEIARELREVMAAAYSLLNKSLCGRAAEDLAALSLVHDIDHAAMAVVWLGHLLKRWNTLVADPADFVSRVRRLDSLRSFLAARLATTWAARGSSVQGFDAFCYAAGQVEEALVVAAREFATSETLRARRTWATVTKEAHRRLRKSWQQLRRCTRDLHQVLFPDDWMPDEATTTVPMWPVSIPEGRRLEHLCVVLRSFVVARRSMVRRGLAAAGMSAQEVHEFDTLTELFLWQPDPDTQLPPLDPARAGTPGTVVGTFAEKITLAEIQVGCLAADERKREQFLKVAAACPNVQAYPEHFENAVHLAATYGKFVAENMPDDKLVERIVWRICDRVLAEGGAPMEPSSTAFRTLLDTARQEPLSALVRLLDAEYHVALGCGKARVRTHPQLGRARNLSESE